MFSAVTPLLITSFVYSFKTAGSSSGICVRVCSVVCVCGYKSWSVTNINHGSTMWSCTAEQGSGRQNRPSHWSGGAGWGRQGIIQLDRASRGTEFVRAGPRHAQLTVIRRLRTPRKPFPFRGGRNFPPPLRLSVASADAENTAPTGSLAPASPFPGRDARGVHAHQGHASARVGMLSSCRSHLYLLRHENSVCVGRHDARLSVCCRCGRLYIVGGLRPVQV